MMKSPVLFALLFLSLHATAQWDTKDPEQFQKELDAWYEDPETSALSDSELENFYGLEYFPVKEEYTVVAEITRTPKSKRQKVRTTTNRKQTLKQYCWVSFTIEGKSYQLAIFESFPKKGKGFDDYFTLPFTDETNGETTYGGGRYLGFREKDLQGKAVVIDFNLAYNPSCAYSPLYSCILPPPENHIDFPIKAGVKKWK